MRRNQTLKPWHFKYELPGKNFNKNPAAKQTQTCLARPAPIQSINGFRKKQKALAF